MPKWKSWKSWFRTKRYRELDGSASELHTLGVNFAPPSSIPELTPEERAFFSRFVAPGRHRTDIDL
jgi:hypothetical protein